jgi:hypothetical protein
VPQWYRDLVNHARGYVRSGQEPTLALAQKPRDGYTWIQRQQAVTNDYESGIDTFGLIEEDLELSDYKYGQWTVDSSNI